MEIHSYSTQNYKFSYKLISIISFTILYLRELIDTQKWSVLVWDDAKFDNLAQFPSHTESISIIINLCYDMRLLSSRISKSS